ncbi:MAG TPA: hypothetical protein VGU68_14970 [Ktedonobacteraceae bacterium]|nr:hypothetical protein [Ktedonobacteraceae bacterium]HEV2661909.1 hypothetical protein [Ktedonobacteraceae bacterium]
MSSRTLRMGGWLLVIAAVLSLVTTVLGFVISGPAGPDGPPSDVISIINLVAGILFLIGLPAAYMDRGNGWAYWDSSASSRCG